MQMDPANKKARISLRAAAVRDALEAKEHSHEHRPEGCSWHPEVCMYAYMVVHYNTVNSYITKLSNNCVMFTTIIMLCSACSGSVGSVIMLYMH
jgi:hypothetical protein